MKDIHLKLLKIIYKSRNYTKIILKHKTFSKTHIKQSKIVNKIQSKNAIKPIQVLTLKLL